MDKPDKLMDLPNEVLVEIFKHVDGTTLNEELVLVCKKFNSLVKATKPLFTMENNGIVMGRVGHKKVKAALSKNDHLYIQSISIKGLESLTDLAKSADLVKNQPGLKSVLLSGDFIATSQREALRADRELKKAILSLKYLEFLCLTGLEVSTRFQNNLTKRLRCPHNRKSTHISSWSKNDLKKLESKKRLSILALPKITAEAFNYLMEDSDAEVFRHTVKYFDISGLHWNWIWPEPEVSWKNLRHFKRLSLLTAGEVDGDFWTALPMLTKLNELSLELSMAGLSKIVPTINDHPTQVTSLHLLCDDSIVWKNVREDIRQTFFSYFPKVKSLVLECQIGNPIDVGELFNMFSRWPLEKLTITVYHTQDRSLDMKSVQIMERPSFPNLEEVMFTTYIQSPPGNPIDWEQLFQPVLQQLFRGTQLELWDFGHVLSDYGTLIAWGNKDLDDLVSAWYRPRLAWRKNSPIQTLKHGIEYTRMILEKEFHGKSNIFCLGVGFGIICVSLYFRQK